jgi:hypothetical protein
MLLSRMGSPTCRLHTGRPSLSPPRGRSRARRYTACRWRTLAATPPPGRRGRRSERGARAGHRPFTSRSELPRVHVPAVAGDVPPAREHEARPPEARGRAPPGPFPTKYPWTPRGTSTTSTPSHPATARLMTSRSSVAPGTTVMRPSNLSSFPTLCSRHTPTHVFTWIRGSDCDVLCPLDNSSRKFEIGSDARGLRCGLCGRHLRQGKGAPLLLAVARPGVY